MKNFFFLSLFIPLLLFSKQKVGCVTNYTVNLDYYTELLEEKACFVPFNFADFYVDKPQRAKNIIRWMKNNPFFLPSLKKREVDKILFWNFTHAQYKARLHLLPKEKMVLLMWEPPTVLPKMYLEKSTRLFSRIYTWNDALVDNKTYFKLYYPALKEMIEEPPSFEEKKLCTLVNTYQKCTHKDELYSARVKAVKFFETKPEGEFEFFGGGWEKSFRNYKGKVENKTDTIKNYRFSLCFENMCNVKGYITEKIFDCFQAATVPIYWGASNIEEYIPKGCYIDMRAFASFEELYVFLKSMSKQEYEAYLTCIKNFLKSTEAALFSEENFKKTLLDILSH